MNELSKLGTYQDELAARGPIQPYLLVQVREEGHVVVLTLNDPDTLNCYSVRLTGELRHALGEANRNPLVKAIVLTGAGSAFSSGGDVRRMRNAQLLPAERYEYIRQEFGGVIDEIAGTDKPVIAAVNGHAMGVACFTALACDLIVASERAQFGTAYIKVGLTPLGVSYILAKVLGYVRAYEFCALGEPINARRALELGLINRVVAHDRLLFEAIGLAQRLADGPTRALAFTKQILRRAALSGLEDHLLLGEAIQPLCLGSVDHHEAVEAFAHRRKPAFVGR